ncbi:MAG: response regulator [Polyangiales bacterium]
MTVSVLVVDDERPAREKVVRLLGSDPRFALAGEARNGREALEAILRLRPELVVLDIEMPGLNGFELLEALAGGAQPSVLFSTAFDSHALRAFEAHAVDYLLKPYDAARFQRALDKVYVQRLGIRREQGEQLTLKTVDDGWVQLRQDDVVRISAANKHVCVFTRDARFLLRQPLRELADTLDARFVRVHRGEIVNVRHVLRVEPLDHGDALLVMQSGGDVMLTRTYRKPFMERLSARA